jgi:hypothetical protein
MGVFLSSMSLWSFRRESPTYLKAGSLPKKATKTKNEIRRTPRATARTVPILASVALKQWQMDLEEAL